MTEAFRTIFSELTRALAVLVFASLSFVAQPSAVERYGDSFAVTDAFYCGAGLPGDPGDPRGKRGAASCDACRIATAVDLPLPPVLAAPVLCQLGRGETRVFVSILPTAPVLSGGGPRAPPAFSHA